MTLKSFLNEQECLLANFRLFWLDQNATDPGVYPLEMEDGEWDEMFQIWKEKQP